MLNLLIYFLLTLLCTFQLETSSTVHFCDLKKDLPLCTEKTSKHSKYTVYHTVVSVQDSFKHFIWLYNTNPSIIVAETSKNCSLFIDYSLFLANSPNDSIFLKFDNKTCQPIFGYDKISFTSIDELLRGKVVNRYTLDSIFQNVNDTTDSKTMISDSSYMDGKIKLTFKSNYEISVQRRLPFLINSPFNNLVGLQLRNLPTNSCDSIFALNFDISSSKDAIFEHKEVKIYIDSLGFGIFRSFEVFHEADKAERATLPKIDEFSRFSFFWKDASYADEIRKRSAMLSAKFQLANCSSSTHPPIFRNSYNLSQFCGSIVFVDLNVENCFQLKSYLVWYTECTVGSDWHHIKAINVVTMILLIFIYSLPVIALITVASIISVKMLRKRRDYQLLNESESTETI
ncbi:hypothetical protein MXB_4726 [Myxobolus squamalis]|nr:hypothetical protein MXB_4726 [Myxobolus squamalis]